MWQRKQTLLLSAVVLLDAVLLSLLDQTSTLLSLHMAAHMLIVVVGVLSYKNRKRQVKWVNLSGVLIVAWMAHLFLIEGADVAAAKNVNVWYWIIPVFILVASKWSIRLIKKDEALVRSVDRLR